MRRLLVLALAVVVAGCSSGGSAGTAGHGSGDYPTRGEIWLGTGLAISRSTGPKVTGRSGSFSRSVQTIAVIGHLPAAPTTVADLQVDGQTLWTVVLNTYATPDHEWWFWTSISVDAVGAGLSSGVSPQPQQHTITLMSGYPTSSVVASGSFTLTP